MGAALAFTFMDKVAAPVIAAVMLALGGWVYSESNRVTMVETQVSDIRENLAAIRNDVSFIRGWIMEHSVPTSAPIVPRKDQQ